MGIQERALARGSLHRDEIIAGTSFDPTIYVCRETVLSTRPASQQLTRWSGEKVGFCSAV